MDTYKMNTKIFIGLFTVLFTFMSCSGQTGDKETEVMLETTAGNIRIKLYNDTPLHRDNFIRNVKDGKYDGVMWHRIIRNFMIQTGEQPIQFDTNGDTLAPDPSEWIPAEIVYPKYYHKRGMVAAAREGDDVNPEKKSDHYQFYIVTGRSFNDDQLRELHAARTQQAAELLYAKRVEQNAEKLEALRKARDTKGLSNLLEKLHDDAVFETSENPPTPFNDQQTRDYRTYGGAPWLDGEYTVFGEVVEGMKTVLDIEKTRVNENNRPLKEMKVLKAYVIE